MQLSFSSTIRETAQQVNIHHVLFWSVCLQRYYLPVLPTTLLDHFSLLSESSRGYATAVCQPLLTPLSSLERIISSSLHMAIRFLATEKRYFHNVMHLDFFNCLKNLIKRTIIEIIQET